MNKRVMTRGVIIIGKCLKPCHGLSHEPLN